MLRLQSYSIKSRLWVLAQDTNFLIHENNNQQLLSPDPSPGLRETLADLPSSQGTRIGGWKAASRRGAGRHLSPDRRGAPPSCPHRRQPGESNDPGSPAGVCTRHTHSENGSDRGPATHPPAQGQQYSGWERAKAWINEKPPFQRLPRTLPSMLQVP